MMESAKPGHRDDAAHRRRLDMASHRRVASERHVRAIRVVVRNVLAEDPTQVVLAEHDQVVDDLPTRRGHPSFGKPIFGGAREAACVWAGTRDGNVETAQEIIFLDDLPGTVGRRLQHRTSREAVAALLARARERGFVIVADIHTHPSDWVELSLVDQEHPIEYRVGLPAMVLPSFGTGAPDLARTGVHVYAGNGRWETLCGEDAVRRVCITSEERDR
jgi:hypothetical protein